MNKRRVIYYSDARHYHMYIYDPPIRLEEAYAPVDEAAGTSANTFAYGFGVGPTMFHGTKVGEIWGSRFDEIDDVASWRARENVKSLLDRGLDPLDVLIDRAHEKQMDFWGSLRLTHSSDPYVDGLHNWQFKLDHPEWVLEGDESDPSRKNNFNWIHPEVRAERFALIEEAVQRYDMDGFELDLTFSAYFFEAGEVEPNRHILTEYLRDVRRVVEEAGAQRGRPMSLGARIFPSLEGNLNSGYDIESWLGEGLLDFVVPNVYAQMPIDPDFPFEWVLDLAAPCNCQVYPALGTEGGSVETYRAAAASYWHKGAHGLYLPWFAWPVEAEGRQILSEMGDPDELARQSKTYPVASSHEGCVKRGYRGQLPLELGAEAGGAAQTINLYIAAEVNSTSAQLRLRIRDLSARDKIEVTINGHSLPADGFHYTSVGYLFGWLAAAVPPHLLGSGRNEIGLRIAARAPKLKSTLIVEEAEVLISHQ
jgi:hypothetical protein